MTIDALISEKAKMEERIQSAVNDEIKRFYLKTGLPVDRVHVTIKQINPGLYVYSKYAVTDIECALNLRRYQPPASVGVHTVEIEYVKSVIKLCIVMMIAVILALLLAPH